MTAQPCPTCILPNSCKAFGSCFHQQIGESDNLVKSVVTNLITDNIALKEEMETKNMAAAKALDQICKLYGLPDWDYPGQVVRDIQDILGKWICVNCDQIFDDKDAYRRHNGQQTCEEEQ